MSTRRPITETVRARPEAHDGSAEADLADLAARAGAGESLLSELQEAVDARHPLELLRLASSMVSALDLRTGDASPTAGDQGPEETDRFQASGSRTQSGGEVSLSDFADALLNAGTPQAGALASVMAAMSQDAALAERIRGELRSRRLPVPGWVRRLDQTEPIRARAMTHVFADSEAVAVEVRLPDDRICLVMVYVDHNLSTVVTDAFIADDHLDHVLSHWRDADRSGASADEDLPLPQARAQLTEAIEAGAMTTPPFDTKTWPQCRPLVEWIISMMPPGGTGYQRPQWSAEDLADLTDRFARSPQAADLSEEEVKLADLFVDFATSQGPGDPLRWSPTSVELLLEWLPRTGHATPAHVKAAPQVLRAFVSFSHEERGIARDLTAQTLGPIESHAPGLHEATGEVTGDGRSDLSEGDVERARRMQQIALRRHDPRRGFPHADPRGGR